MDQARHDAEETGDATPPRKAWHAPRLVDLDIRDTAGGENASETENTVGTYTTHPS